MADDQQQAEPADRQHRTAVDLRAEQHHADRQRHFGAGPPGAQRLEASQCVPDERAEHERLRRQRPRRVAAVERPTRGRHGRHDAEVGDVVADVAGERRLGDRAHHGRPASNPDLAASKAAVVSSDDHAARKRRNGRFAARRSGTRRAD
jgi:hypothetical protein